MTEDTILKDLTKFLCTRSKDQIIVVDVNEDNVDSDVSAFIFSNKYAGNGGYKELKMLKGALKNTASGGQSESKSSESHKRDSQASDNQYRGPFLL